MIVSGGKSEPIKETLNKSIRDLSETVTGKRGFPVTYKINRSKRLILAVHPCTAEALT